MKRETAAAIVWGFILAAAAVVSILAPRKGGRR